MTADVPRTPWVGARFNETRLLIIGESHYGNEADRDDLTLTNAVVNNVVAGCRFRFFTLMEAAVTGCASNVVRPDQFWQTVAFANFAQGAAELGSRPTRQMWANGKRLFHKVLDDVKPTHLLFASQAAWDKTDGMTGINWDLGKPLTFEGKQVATGYFTSVGTGVRVYSTVINHPQARGRIRGQLWHPLIREFMARSSV